MRHIVRYTTLCLLGIIALTGASVAAARQRQVVSFSAWLLDQLFLNAEGGVCATPCLMGVEAGMTLDGAANTLRAHPLVDFIYRTGLYEAVGEGTGMTVRTLLNGPGAKIAVIAVFGDRNYPVGPPVGDLVTRLGMPDWIDPIVPGGRVLLVYTRHHLAIQTRPAYPWRTTQPPRFRIDDKIEWVWFYGNIQSSTALRGLVRWQGFAAARHYESQR